MKTLTYEELQCKANAIENMEKSQGPFDFSCGNAHVLRQKLAEDLIRLGFTMVWQMDVVKLARSVKKDRPVFSRHEMKAWIIHTVVKGTEDHWPEYHAEKPSTEDIQFNIMQDNDLPATVVFVEIIGPFDLPEN